MQQLHNCTTTGLTERNQAGGELYTWPEGSKHSYEPLSDGSGKRWQKAEIKSSEKRLKLLECASQGGQSGSSHNCVQAPRCKNFCGHHHVKTFVGTPVLKTFRDAETCQQQSKLLQTFWINPLNWYRINWPGYFVALEGEERKRQERKKKKKDNILAENVMIICNDHKGCFFRWYPPKKLKYGKPRLGVSTLT